MSIFIPKTCRVGFQKRSDTFAGKLAYVIYYDNSGKLRKETSWKGWCDKKIDAYDFENKPTSGFVLNKGIQRCRWHFGSGRSLVRIYDPRGVEFEITPDNLLWILMHTDCSKREIQGDLVYAWDGTELILLPCVSEEYDEAKEFTRLQGKSINAKDLKEGFTYATKYNEQLVYLGRHMYYSLTDGYKSKATRQGKMEHIFCYFKTEDEYDYDEDDEDKPITKKKGKPKLTFRTVKSIPSLIADVLTDHPHDQLANWIDAYLKTEESSEIVSWVENPLQPKQWNVDWKDWRANIEAAVKEGGVYYRVNIKKYERRYGRNRGSFKDDDIVYERSCRINSDGSTVWCANDQDEPRKVDDRSIFFELYAVFKNGIKRKWR